MSTIGPPPFYRPIMLTETVFDPAWVKWLTDLSTVQTTTGQYVPTLTAGTNVASVGAVSGQFRWTRSGTSGFVSGIILNLAQTAGGNTFTTLGISLPFPSDLQTFSDLIGNGNRATLGSLSAAILADTANNRAQMQFTADVTSAASWSVFFRFEIR